MAVHSFVWLYFFNMIPNLSKEINEGLRGWRELLNRSISTSMWPACLIALGGTLFAPLIVETTYGERFSSAVMPFQVAIWMIPVAWLSGHFRFSLIAGGHQRLECAACAAAGATTVLASFPGFIYAGAPGAAAALVLGGLVNLVLAYVAVVKVIGPVTMRAAVTPILSCTIAGTLAVVVTWFTDPILGAVVAILFFLVRATSQWNVARLRLAWQGRLD
jgi:O-antigen/teichoic acid export membrane protein